MSNGLYGGLCVSVSLPEGAEQPWVRELLHALDQVPGLQRTGFDAQPLDVFLRLGPDVALSQSPKYGVWTLQLINRGRYLREAVVLQALSGRSRILERQMLPVGLPVAESLAILASAVPKLCRLLLAGHPLPDEADKPLRGAPARFWHPLSDQIHNTLLTEIWQVGVVQAPIHRFLDPDFRPQVEWIPNVRPHHFFADPFAVSMPEGLRIIAEEYDYLLDPVGRICEFGWGNGDFLLPPQRVLPSATHMSYPFLFHFEGALYCIPETWQQHRIRLHRWNPDARTWDDGPVLIDGIAAIDSTVIRHDGRWWLFCTEKGPGVDCRLLLWYADQLDGPWSPHLANPVKVDVRSARPGGTPFVSGGALYRPAQDCSESYGCRLAINRVAKLTPEEFSEEVVRVLTPLADWPCRDGWHTLSAAGAWTVIDAKRMSFLPEMARRRTVHKLQRIGQLAGGRKN